MFWFKKKPPNWLPSDYPVYAAPHVGMPWELTDDQAKENFDYLLQNKQFRIEALANLLTKFDIDLQAGLSAESPDQLLIELHNWSGEYWHQLPKSKAMANLSMQRDKDSHWFNSDCSGDDLIYSVITDTGIALGEQLIRQMPSAYWSLVLDKEDVADKMLFAQRHLVLIPRNDGLTRHSRSDVILLAMDRYASIDSFDHKYANPWLMSAHGSIEIGIKGSSD